MAKRKKKKRSFWYYIGSVAGYLSLVVVLIFSVLVFKLNVLPIPYLLLGVLLLIILSLGSILSIHKFKKPFKVIGFLFAILLISISSIGSYYVYHTDLFLNKSFHSGKLSYSTTYYVVANKNGTEKLTKEKIEAISYYKDAFQIEEAIHELNLESGKTITNAPYDDVSKMFLDLQNQVIPTILVEQSSYDLVFQINKELVKDNFEVVFEYKVNTEIDNNVANIGKSFNIYIGGNDFTNSLMDFNMIVTVNMDTGEILMTSIPRDYYIEVDGYNGKKDTLSYMGARGIETNRKSLENFLGIHLDYFIKINTLSLVGIIDQVGGINYCSDVSYTTTHAMILNDYDDRKGEKLFVQKGCQELNGIQALTVARERLAFPDGDRQRQKNCQKIILAIVERLKTMNTLTNYNNILNNLGDLYQTSIPREVISELLKQTIQNGGNWQFKEQSMDGTNASGYVHLTDLIDYVMKPNMDSVNVAKQEILRVLG